MPIPKALPIGILPPFLKTPTRRDGVSPYRATPAELVDRYASSPQRIRILEGLLAYRGELRRVGLSVGFQWIDGSFVETLNPAPNDIDIVTVSSLPVSCRPEDEHLFNAVEAKRRFLCDAYFVDLTNGEAMTRTDDLAYLEAQRTVVQMQLEQLRPEQRLMRINLESRLGMIDDEIAVLGLEEGMDRRVKVLLTFGGKPVIEEAGAIEATFGAEALQAWQRLVSTTAATREGRKLSARGRIPDAETYRLFITGTSPGSFSFELEDVASMTQPEPSVLHDAVDQASLLLQATQMDAESYVDAVAESNPRVIRALEDFLGLMESRGATLRVAFEERECLFDTPDKVARAAERTRKTNITEAEEPIRGVLSGVFAMGRRFEFQREESGEVISGRIAHDIVDPSSLKPHLWTRCLAHMGIVTVERVGEKQRTYYLRSVEPLADGERVRS